MYDDLTFKEVIENIGVYQDKLFHRDLNDPKEDDLAFSLTFGPLLASQLSWQQTSEITPPLKASDISVAEFLALFRTAYCTFRLYPENKDLRNAYMHQIRDLDAFLRSKTENYWAEHARAAKNACNEYARYYRTHKVLSSQYGYQGGTFKVNENAVTAVAPIVPYGATMKKQEVTALDGAESASDDGTGSVDDVVNPDVTLNDILDEYLRLGPWIFDVMGEYDLDIPVNYRRPEALLRKYYERCRNIEEGHDNELIRACRDLCKAILSAFTLYFGSTPASIESAQFFYDPKWYEKDMDDIMFACEGLSESQPIDLETIQTQVKDMNDAYHHAMKEFGGDLHDEVAPLQIDKIRDFVRSTREFRPNRQVSSLFISTNQDDTQIVGWVEDAPIALCRKTKHLVVPVNDIIEDYRPLLVVMDPDGKVHVENTLNVTNL